MVKELPSTTASEAEPAAGPARTTSIPAPESEQVEGRVASHGTPLADAKEGRCDACGATLRPSDEDGYDLPGRGVYLWLRGGEVHLEDVPLCASCASAIGMTALARWEIEEEEG